mmetsp:Transcript_24255/g.60761  ORF Transcript_24255/g.60761 Transcript_24255/m.60761 type:complete len:203 (-) Transcript_24255:465-1073(-)
MIFLFVRPQSTFLIQLFLLQKSGRFTHCTSVSILWKYYTSTFFHRKEFGNVFPYLRRNDTPMTAFNAELAMRTDNIGVDIWSRSILSGAVLAPLTQPRTADPVPARELLLLKQLKHLLTTLSCGLFALVLGGELRRTGSTVRCLREGRPTTVLFVEPVPCFRTDSLHAGRGKERTEQVVFTDKGRIRDSATQPTVHFEQLLT